MLHLNHPCHKSNNTFIDNAEDLDIVVPMYSLLKYSDNYFLYQEVFRSIIEMKKMMMQIKILIIG